MQHSGQHRVRYLMSGYVHEGDPGHPLASPQICSYGSAAFFLRLLYPCLQIVPFLEIDVDDVITADQAVKRNRLSVNVDSL